MNKIIIPIIIILLIIVGVSIFLIIPRLKLPVTKHEDSPFGIHGPYITDKTSMYSKSDITNYLADIGIKWVRLIEPELESVEQELSGQNINILAMVGRKELGDSGGIRKIVRKYKDRIKYWQVGNEPDLGPKYSPNEYARLLKQTYEAVKSECKDCVIVFGGLVGGHVRDKKGQQYFESVLESGGGDYFDVFDFHFPGPKGDYLNLKESVSVFKDILRRYGFTNKPIWITEMSTYDGDVGRGPAYPFQSEADQAAELLKRYVYGVRLGIKKMFWNLIVERHGFGQPSGDNYFDNVGLIHNPENDDQSHKKLSYYAYKLMVEKLEDSDWNNIETIQEYDDIYTYKFTKQGKPVWVAWNDNPEDKQITISGITSTQVKITEAVLNAESGDDLNGNDYPNFFNTETKTVSNGKVTLTLGENPVFMEEII